MSRLQEKQSDTLLRNSYAYAEKKTVQLKWVIATRNETKVNKCLRLRACVLTRITREFNWEEMSDMKEMSRKREHKGSESSGSDEGGKRRHGFPFERRREDFEATTTNNPLLRRNPKFQAKSKHEYLFSEFVIPKLDAPKPPLADVKKEDPPTPTPAKKKAKNRSGQRQRRALAAARDNDVSNQSVLSANRLGPPLSSNVVTGGAAPASRPPPLTAWRQQRPPLPPPQSIRPLPPPPPPRRAPFTPSITADQIRARGKIVRQARAPRSPLPVFGSREEQEMDRESTEAEPTAEERRTELRDNARDLHNLMPQMAAAWVAMEEALKVVERRAIEARTQANDAIRVADDAGRAARMAATRANDVISEAAKARKQNVVIGQLIRTGEGHTAKVVEDSFALLDGKM